MEENGWIKYKEIQEVSELATQEYILIQEKQYWEEILKQVKFGYKFKIEQMNRYKEATRYKGALRTVYVLNLYIKEEII